MDNTPASIVFFDGECGLCNGFVDFIIRRDTRRIYKYAPIQGTSAKQLLPPEIIEKLDSMALKTEDVVLLRSDAGLQILSGLGGAWKLVNALKIFPRFIRDAVYNLISKYRYRIFGKRETCRIPTREERSLFLD